MEKFRKAREHLRLAHMLLHRSVCCVFFVPSSYASSRKPFSQSARDITHTLGSRWWWWWCDVQKQ